MGTDFAAVRCGLVFPSYPADLAPVRLEAAAPADVEGPALGLK